MCVSQFDVYVDVASVQDEYHPNRSQTQSLKKSPTYVQLPRSRPQCPSSQAMVAGAIGMIRVGFGTALVGQSLATVTEARSLIRAVVVMRTMPGRSGRSLKQKCSPSQSTLHLVAAAGTVAARNGRLSLTGMRSGKPLVWKLRLPHCSSRSPTSAVSSSRQLQGRRSFQR